MGGLQVAAITFLFLFPPAGIVLLWVRPFWTARRRWTLTVLSTLWLAILVQLPKQPSPNSANVARESHSSTADHGHSNQAAAEGLRKTEEGIVSIIEQLRDGSLSLSEAKTLLIYHDPFDDFRVESVTGSHVIYRYRSRSVSVQIAVVRATGGFYGEGAELLGTAYVVAGTQRFATLAGAEKELVVFRQVK